MVDLNYSLVIQIVNFLVLIFALNALLYKPVRAVLKQRKEKMDGLRDGIDSAEKGAKAKVNEYEAGIKEARGKGMDEKEAILQVAAEEEKEKLAKINESAQAELAKVKEKIASETASVRNQLLNEIDSFAGSICQKVLGRSI